MLNNNTPPLIPLVVTGVGEVAVAHASLERAQVRPQLHVLAREYKYVSKIKNKKTFRIFSPIISTIISYLISYPIIST